MVAGTRNILHETRDRTPNQQTPIINRYRRQYTMVNGYLVRRDNNIPLNQPIPEQDRFDLDQIDGDIGALNATWAAARRHLKNSTKPEHDVHFDGVDNQYEPGELHVLIGTAIGYQSWLLKRYLRANTVIRQFVLLSKDIPIDPTGDIAWYRQKRTPL